MEKKAILTEEDLLAFIGEDKAIKDVGSELILEIIELFRRQDLIQKIVVGKVISFMNEIPNVEILGRLHIGVFRQNKRNLANLYFAIKDFVNDIEQFDRMLGHRCTDLQEYRNKLNEFIELCDKEEMYNIYNQNQINRIDHFDGSRVKSESSDYALIEMTILPFKRTFSELGYGVGKYVEVLLVFEKYWYDIVPNPDAMRKRVDAYLRSIGVEWGELA